MPVNMPYVPFEIELELYYGQRPTDLYMIQTYRDLCILDNER